MTIVYGPLDLLTRHRFELMLTAGVVLLASCTTSASELPSVGTSAAFRTYTRDRVGLAPDQKGLLRIGHRGGALDHYPKKLHGSGICPKRWQLKTIRELMFASFSAGSEWPHLDAIEIDLHLGDDGVVQVVHDKVKLNKAPVWAQHYLHENRLSSVIATFVRAEYYKEHRLYLELKKADDWVKLAAAIDQEITSALPPEKADEVIAALGFISFWPEALEAVHQAKRLSQVATHLILADDRWYPTKLGGHLPVNDKLVTRLNTMPWLRGIWYSPAMVTEHRAWITKANAGRAQPLELFIAVYFSDDDDFPDQLGAAAAGELENVVGLIVDIGSEDEAANCD